MFTRVFMLFRKREALNRRLVSFMMSVALLMLFLGGASAQVPSVSPPPFQPSTFMAAVQITPAALTAGDLFCIYGSATRLIRVKSLQVSGIANTTLQSPLFALVKRSAVDTGGTSTNPTAVPLDTGQTVSAATATITAYTGVPTAGAAVGTISERYLALNIATAGLVLDRLEYNWYPSELFTEPRLRSASQGVCLNAVNAFTTNAPSLAIEIVWTEN